MDSAKANSPTAANPDTHQARAIGSLFLDGIDQHLEAFSGNGLYYNRGMPDMKKYKTVKEVCALTGLTGKHLYYFHHENVVRATAYANYSVEGNDGYKLYDSKAVEKLQHIALYYQLGLKRNEIRDLMLSPDYDSNAVLDSLLTRELEKRAKIDRNIAVLNCMKLTGTKNSLAGILCGTFWDVLCRQTAEAQRVGPGTVPPELAASLAMLKHSDFSESSFLKLFAQASREAFLYLLGVFVSALGEGTAAQGFQPEHGRAALHFLAQHPEVYAKYLSDKEDT